MTEPTFPTDAPAPAQRLPGDPTISVVVTCYNYGHFLEACLDSLYDQSVAPDEIIVVDDGSTDASGTLLAAHSDRVTVIATSNHGQAGAFNRGFAASTCDIVLFLDADDLLDPCAIETIATFWANDLAALTFGLRTIDGAGRGIGVYTPSVRADAGDNRPRLLSFGTFAFPPTSGNAFSRAFLSAVLPMPEQRWRISADCYLIRAAALFGRFAHVPRVLGSYRIHGGNNYALGIDDAPDLARHTETQTDVADALWALADTAATFTNDREQASALATTLRHRARAVLDDLDRRDTSAAQIDEYAVAYLGTPRWPRHLPFDTRIDAQTNAAGPSLEDMVVPDITARGDLVHVRNAISCSIDPHPDALVLKLDIAQPDAGAGRIPITVRIDGVPAWQSDLEGTAQVTVPLRQNTRDICRRLRIDVDAPGRDRSAAMVRGLEVVTRGSTVPAPLLDPTGWRPLDEALGAALDPCEWKTGPTSAASLLGDTGQLRFSVQAAGNTDLMLDFGGWPPRGSLILSENGQILFVGTLGDQRRIFVRLPTSSVPVRPYDLQIRFDPDGDDPGDQHLSIAAIGLRAHGQGSAPLNLGETVHFQQGRDCPGYLADGWDAPEQSGTRNLMPEATLTFRPPEGAAALRVRLDLATVLEAIPGLQHVVGVSMGGDLIAALALDGPGTIEVPLPDIRDRRDVRLVLHSAYLRAPDNDTGGEVDPRPEKAPDMTDVLAILELRSVTLVGLEGPMSTRMPMPRATPPHRPAIQRLLDRARQITDSGPDADAAALRADLVAFFQVSSPAACLLTVATPGGVERLTTIGARTRHLPFTPAEQATRDAVQSPCAEADTLRRALLTLLLARPAEAPQMTDFDQWPAPLFWASPALADWLTASIDIETAEEHGQYVAYLMRLLGNVDAILAREPEGSALFRLAALIVERLRMTRAIFGSGPLRNLIRLRGRAIERLLAFDGAPLAAPRPARDATTRLRVGVMVRDVTPSPEGWALVAMYGALDPDRFERVLIRLDAKGDQLDTGDTFAEELNLAGFDLPSSVQAIRALDLDMFLTGAYAGEWEKAGLILAHRLAPVQVWPGAVCPTTTGFRSFDVALSARATEPDDAQQQYMQPMAWIDGPLQAAYDFPRPARTSKTALRQALGLKPGRILLTSGAMAHKITDTLLAAWAQILANAPNVDLVLYPFAPNWSITFAEDRFRARIDRHLAELGVAPDRVHLLATQTTDAVSAIVRAADLYLDSFPYTGATTVCEALSQGTPVLTLAGTSLRELTGTSWVRAFGLPDLVADTPATYVAKASALAQDPAKLKAQRDILRARLAEGPPPHRDARAFGAAFSDALWRIAEGSGKIPALLHEPAWDMAAIDRATRQNVPSPAVVLRMTPAASRLVVLTSPRSGSSLFCHMLNATPAIRCHYELFHEQFIEFFGDTVTDPAAISERDADPVGFLDRTMARGFDEGHRLIGFKHMWFFSQAVSAVIAADPGVRIVILRRNNLLAKFSSLRIAEKTRQWKVSRGDTVKRPRIKFDEDRFGQFEKWDIRLNRELTDLLARNRRDALFLEYTDLAAPETGQRLGEFLGMGVRWNTEVGLQRLNPGRILDRFTNPAAVRAFLAQRGVPEWADNG